MSREGALGVYYAATCPVLLWQGPYGNPAINCFSQQEREREREERRESREELGKFAPVNTFYIYSIIQLSVMPIGQLWHSLLATN